MSGLPPVSSCMQLQIPSVSGAQFYTGSQKKCTVVSLGVGRDPNHQFYFLCLPFSLVILLSLHSFVGVALGSQTPHSILVCPAGSPGCSRGWFCSIPFLFLRSLSLSIDRRHSSWGCSCWSYQPAKTAGGQHSEERRSTQKGLTSSAIHTNLLLPGKSEGFQPFWEPQRIFLHLPTGGELGQTLDWIILKPSQPTNRFCSKDMCVELSKAKFKAVQPTDPIWKNLI